MKLIAHVIDGHHVDIRPAPVERDWMEATNQRFAYRCLPLNIANAWVGGSVQRRLPRHVVTARPRTTPSSSEPTQARGARRSAISATASHLPSAVPVPHRAGRRADGAGAHQPAEGRYRARSPA